MSVSDQSRSAELARELNAMYGLLQFARARCYPAALTARLQALLQSVEAEMDAPAAAGARLQN